MLLSVLALYTVGQAAFAYTVWRHQEEVAIGGRAYTDVVLAKDLVADVLPPPAYLVEAQLVATELGYASTPAQQDEKIARLGTLRKEFETRQTYWRDHLEAGELRDALVEKSYTPAMAWFATLEESYIPAIRAGNAEAARQVLEGPLAAHYAEHRAAIDTVVTQSGEWLTRTETEARAANARGTNLLLGIGILNFVTVAAGFIWTMRRISSQLDEAVDALVSVADRDLSVSARTDGNEEFAVLGSSLNTALARLGGAFGGFAKEASHVEEAAGRLDNLSKTLAAASSENLRQSESMHELANGISMSLSTVAAATEEMSATVGSISESAAEAAAVAGQAVRTTESARLTVTRLERSSAEIGEVARVIQAIAEQTNLLALNATIEAARAGEAGRGFAVVANEVKELARQTKDATEQITSRIHAIQGDSHGMIEVMTEISAVISRVNDAQSTIAAAVREQGAATQEIAQRVTDAATSSRAIVAVAESSCVGALRISGDAGDIQSAGGELAALAGTLRLITAEWTMPEEPIEVKPLAPLAANTSPQWALKTA